MKAFFRFCLPLLLVTGLVSGVLAVSAAPGRAAVHKTMVILEENHNRTQAEAGMPYLVSLENQFGKATGYNAITHPSLPNYLAIWGGSTFGVTSDCSVGSSGCIPSPPSAWGQALAAGSTAKAYQESMTSNCQTGGSGSYAPRHGPWPYWTDSTERAGCNANDVPMGTTVSGNLLNDINSGSLPVTGEMTPNLCNDAHDSCGGDALAHADAWLQGWVPKLMAGPDYQAGNLTIIVTFDEGDSNQNVLFAVIDPGLSAKVVTGSFNHYALTRWLDDNAGVSELRNAASAGDLRAAFGLGGPVQPMAPAVTTGAASGVGQTTATLNGAVNPEGQATAYQFDYGTTTAYGTSVPSPAGSAGSGTTAVSESSSLAGLTASTTYHYRIEATNATGTSFGADQSFTTAAVQGNCPVTGTTSQEQDLASAICNVPADAQYDLHDSAGHSMDTMKVVSTSGGTPAFVAVYHTCAVSPCQVLLGGSSDLRTWTYEGQLTAGGGSQPAIKRLTDGSYLMPYEGVSPSHVTVNWYPTLADLLAGNSTRSYSLPNTLGTCQGTPNIYSPVGYTNPDSSLFTLGFHESQCGDDREATTKITNFASSCESVSDWLNTALQGQGAAGKLGDRDAVWHGAHLFDVVEGNTSTTYSPANWRLYLYGFTENGAVQLPVHTAGGSTAFENPTVSALTIGGVNKLVISLFIPSEGAAPGEAGELLYTVPDTLGPGQSALPAVLQNAC
ncbi:MAG TPA: alkaline phosphatase family protein [Geobacteraceae bacterium]|nr:alkaline phosphatase family protein [Geobacteraceae bacterium]